MQEKPSLALLVLKKSGGTYPTVISREIKSTFAHTLKILSKFEELKIVKSEERGRIRFVRLTDLGESLASILEKFSDLGEIIETMAQVEKIYEEEVKGHLREEINKPWVLERLAECEKRIRDLLEKGDEIERNARKCLNRMEEVKKEVTGVIVGFGD